MNCYMGIDAGVTGAIAVIGRDGRPDVFDVPVIGEKRKDYHIEAIVEEIFKPMILRATLSGATLRVCIEDLHALPPFRRKKAGADGGDETVQRTSAVANFSLGGSLMFYRVICAMLGLQLERVSPQRWKKDLGLQMKLGGKEASRQKAIELFPGLAPQLARKKDHGRAEAVLIAEWRRRQG